MFEQMPLSLLSIAFVAAGAVVWIAGIYVSKTTDVLSSRFKLGEALGGAILLAIVTNLPEIAASLSPRPLCLAGAVNAAGERMQAGKVRALYPGGHVDVRDRALWDLPAGQEV